MRTYYSFTIFAELACELNTNQKNDLQTQSAFCQVCLLVSGQSTFFWGYFQQIMQSISAEKRPKNVQNPSVCKRFMISGSVSESWVFQSNGRPELVPAVLDKVLALAATVECLQISFLGLGSAKMIYKQFLRFYKQLLEFYKQFLEFYKQLLELINSSWNFAIHSEQKLQKTCRRKGDDTLLGNPKPQSPENLSPRKFWRPWSDEVPDTEVLGCKNEIFDFRGCLELTASYSQNRVIVVASLPGISQATRYGVLVRKGLRKKKTRPTDNRIQVMMRSHSQVLANYQQVCRALVLRPCMLRRSQIIACLGKVASLSLILLTRETVES